MLTRRRLQSTLIWEELPLRCCFSMMMARTHGMRCCTNLLLLTVRWSATTGCFIKALKVSSFYRDKKKVSPIKHTRRHTATKRQTHINHAFILSLQGFAIVKSHQWASPEFPYPFLLFLRSTVLSVYNNSHCSRKSSAFSELRCFFDCVFHTLWLL